MARSRENTGPATPITSTTPNMESATIAAAGAPRRAKPRRASPPAPWRARCMAGVVIRGALVQIGPHKIDRARFDWDEVEKNPFFCPDKDAAARWADYLDDIRKAGSSIGAVIELEAVGVPVGWGAPIYGKLDAELASALMSINAVKGVEIGAGFAAAELTGEDNADEMRRRPGRRAGVFVEPRRRRAGGHIDGPADHRALRGEANLVDPHAAPHHRQRRRRDRDCHQGPPRSMRRHQGRAGRRGDDGLRAGRPVSAPSRASGVRLSRREALALGAAAPLSASAGEARTLFVAPPSALIYDPGPGRWDRPERIAAIDAALAGEPFGALLRAEAPRAPSEALLRAHDAAYIARIAAGLPTGVDDAPMMPGRLRGRRARRRRRRPRRERGHARRGQKRLRRDAAARPSRSARRADGLLLFQQRRRRGASRHGGAWRRARGHRRFRRASRQWRAANFLGREKRPLLLNPSNAALPRHGRRLRARRVRQYRQRPARQGRRRRGFSRRRSGSGFCRV